jgi:hypothetical protein
MKKNAPADNVAALVYALERMLRLEEAPDLKQVRWVCKVLALANLLDRFKRSYQKDLVLPPRIEKWPESRLAEVARHAEHWFEKRVRPSGNTRAPATGAPPTQNHFSR